jgi:hypothetical protein
MKIFLMVKFFYSFFHLFRYQNVTRNIRNYVNTEADPTENTHDKIISASL